MVTPINVMRRVAGVVDRTAEGAEHRIAERRRLLLTFRVTDAEMDMLNTVAVREGRSVSEVVRSRVFTERRRSVGVRPASPSNDVQVEGT